MSNAWRRVAAALANAQQRDAYSRAVLGLPADNPKAVAALARDLASFAGAATPADGANSRGRR